MSLSSIVDRVLTVGIPAYVDLQQSKLRINDPTPAIQNPDGGYSAQGQAAPTSAQTFISTIPTWAWALGAVAVVGLTVLVLRK